MSSLLDVLKVVAIGAFVAVAVWSIALYLMNRRRASLALPLPAGALVLRTTDDSLTEALSDALAGRLMLALCGTYAARVGLRLLRMLDDCGLQGVVGSVLLVELDADRRRAFLRDVPPVFRDRLQVASCAALPGGGHNQDIDWLEAWREFWAPQIVAGARAVCDTHLRRTPESTEPATILCLVSLGATGYMGYRAIREICRRYPRAQAIGATAYPEHRRLRRRAKRVMAAYEKAGVRAWIVADNLPDVSAPDRDPMVNDHGLVAVIMGLIGAAQTSDVVNESNNVLTQVLPEDGLSLVTYRTYITDMPAHAHGDPTGATTYWVPSDSVAMAALHALHELDDPCHQAAAGDLGDPDCSRFDLVLMPLEPAALLEVQDSVTSALRTVDRLQPNQSVLFAATRDVVDPDQPSCVITAVRIEALSHPLAHLDQISGEAGPTVEPARPVEASGNGFAPVREAAAGRRGR